MSQESVFNRDYFLESLEETEKHTLKDGKRVDANQLEELRKLGLLIEKD